MSYIGFYPSYGIVDIRISGTDEDAERILKIKKTVFNLLHKFIFTEDFRSVEQVLGDKLNERGLTLGLGESLTGGLIGERITSVPGSSDYFMGAAITYSNKSKIDILKVESCTIEKYGAVSAEVCLEMVEGVKKRFNVDCAIATTGIAGPGGGSKNKPVGLVFIGVSLFDKVILKRYTLSGNRNMIRERATNYSIFNLIKLLERSK
jgi:nicotinamide-nucleotide amidase